MVTSLPPTGTLTDEVIGAGEHGEVGADQRQGLFRPVGGGWRRLTRRLFGSVNLLCGLDQPLILLPRAIGLRAGRLVALCWAVLFYGRFSLFLVYDQIGLLLRG